MGTPLTVIVGRGRFCKPAAPFSVDLRPKMGELNRESAVRVHLPAALTILVGAIASVKMGGTGQDSGS